jgi:hypothetical protein
MRELIAIVVLCGACGSNEKSMPPIAKRNFEAAKQAADAAMEACAQLYREPHGCFRYMPDQTWGDASPNVPIAPFWKGDKADITTLQAECTWSRESFMRTFPDAKIEGGLGGSPGCSFRPYPGIPKTLNPGPEGECSTLAPYKGWTNDLEGKSGEVVYVPYAEQCAGRWEAIEVTRITPDLELVLTVWFERGSS